MKDEHFNQPPLFKQRSDALMNDAENPDEALAEDLELKSMLECWTAPDAPASLERNLRVSYRRWMERATLEDNSLHNSLPDLALLPSEEVKTMKQCQTCSEEFADKFSFCPVDGTPLEDLTISSALESEPLFSLGEESESGETFAHSNLYHLTIIEDAGLVRRLTTEVREAAHQSQLTWPEFKRDPVGFTRRSATAYGTMAWRFFSGPNVAIATLAAILFMMTTIIGLVWLDRHRAQSLAMNDRQRDDLILQEMVTDIPDEMEKPDEGPAGRNKGTGGGSKPKQEKPGGGGGGGREEQKPASYGKLPPGSLDVPQIVAPNPKPPPPVKNPLIVPPTLVVDPLLLPVDPSKLPYGDPKSKSTDPSSGSGKGGGIGEGEGSGVGPGQGGGYGPGRGGNVGGGDFNQGGGGPGGGGGGTDYNKVFKPNEVTQKARIISKPSPEYTEEARKNQVTGRVVLQMVLSSSGSVTGIRTISGLPNGLTEKAIQAARRIQFSPAMKDGRAVSQYVKVEYNFNIY